MNKEKGRKTKATEEEELYRGVDWWRLGQGLRGGLSRRSQTEGGEAHRSNHTKMSNMTYM